jgi:plasmid maintenance system antidote protein VapI
MPFIFLILSLFNNHAFASSSPSSCLELFKVDSQLQSSRRSLYPNNPHGLVDRLMILLRETGLSQADLTRLLQFETSAKVNKIIRKNQILILHDVVIIAQATGFNSWWLLTGEGDKYSSQGVGAFFSYYNKDQFVTGWKVSFAEKLKAAMLENSITGLRLADHLNYEDGKISKVLTGTQELMPEAAIKALRFLQVDAEYVLNFPITITKEKEVVSSQKTNSPLSSFDSDSLLRELIDRGWEIHNSPEANTSSPGIILKFNK